MTETDRISHLISSEKKTFCKSEISFVFQKGQTWKRKSPHFGGKSIHIEFVIHLATFNFRSNHLAGKSRMNYQGNARTVSNNVIMNKTNITL